MGLTLVEKIAARHADGLAPGTEVRSGDFVSIRPRHVMTHDNTGAVIPKFKQIGATSIADPAQPVLGPYHFEGTRGPHETLTQDFTHLANVILSKAKNL